MNYHAALGSLRSQVVPLSLTLSLMIRSSVKVESGKVQDGILKTPL